MMSWRPVVSFEGFYEVSAGGRVRRIRPARGTRVGKVLAIRHDKCGYVQVRLTGAEGRSFYRTVHSLVARAFIGAPPEGFEVNHKNEIRDDNRVGNLEWVRHAENTPRGSRHGNAKLTMPEVLNIRASTGSCALLARRFGVSASLISQLRRGIGWRELQGRALN